ncbi:hypothetical protein L7F22_054177 [Adiantum nelumboides]|nr:hypothetical protein [Adiantum nelumboides]MCO5600069.1 hypothetical protein [Adiantum nelumboides]
MVRSRKPPPRKPLAPKDSNIHHHPHHSNHNEAAKQMMVDANHREADRRVAAIKAVCDAEVEGYLTQLRVALSMLPKELRGMPIGEFVSRFCSDREFIRAPDSHIVELRPKLAECPSVADSFEFHGHSNPSVQGQPLPTQHGFPFSTSMVKDFSTQIASKAAQHDESEDEEFLKFMESFRSSKFFQSNIKTPATCDPSMVGVTPKTMRLPKTGETLVSVNGSPLGIYDKDGMTSIREERPRQARRRLRASTMLSNV